MATTKTLAIPYAGPADAPDVPYWSQRQAERTEALLSAQDVTAAVAKMPLGLVGKNIFTTDSPSTSGNTMRVVMSVPTVTFTAGRNYRIRWEFSINVTNVDTQVFMQIQRAEVTDPSSATTGLTNLQGRTMGARPGIHHDSVEAYFAPTTTKAYQIKGTAVRVAGTGTLGMPNSLEPALLLVEDLGAQI